MYAFQVLVGLSFAGLIIVGINYFLEFQKRDLYDVLVFILLIVEAVLGIFITIWF